MGFYEISVETQLILIGCIISFILGESIGIEFKNKNYIIDPRKEKLLINFSIFLLVLFFPFFYHRILSLSDLGFANVLSIRDAMTEANKSEGIDTIISIGLNFPIVLSFFYSITENKISKKLLIIYFLSFAYVFLSFSKGYLLQLMIPTLFALWYTKKIKNKHFIFLSILPISFSILLFAIRDSAVEGYLLLKMYTLAPLAAFDRIVNGYTPLNVPQIEFFSIFYEIFNIKIIQGKYEHWSDIEEPTNVFTAFGVIFNDLGYFIFLFFFIYGFISRISFLMAKKTNSPLWIFMNSWLLYGVIVSFFSDGFVGLISTNSKYIIIIWILSILAKKRSSP